jgi:hypothetical protein
MKVGMSPAKTVLLKTERQQNDVMLLFRSEPYLRVHTEVDPSRSDNELSSDPNNTLVGVATPVNRPVVVRERKVGLGILYSRTRPLIGENL